MLHYFLLILLWIMIFYYWKYCGCAAKRAANQCENLTAENSRAPLGNIPYDNTFQPPWTADPGTISDDFLARTIPKTRVVYNAQSGEIYTDYAPR